MNVGLVAHDGKKNLMQNLCIAYQDILKKHKLYATSTTGQMIEDVANLKIHKLLAGHFGGMQQMGSKISNNEIDLLIFLQDPSNKKRTPDFYNVLNLCDQYNIPMCYESSNCGSIDPCTGSRRFGLEEYV